MTVAHSWIDNGDDNIAIKQGVTHMSVLDNHFYTRAWDVDRVGDGAGAVLPAGRWADGGPHDQRHSHQEQREARRAGA